VAVRKLGFGLLLLLGMQTCLIYSEDHKPSGFYFGGKLFYLGMSEDEAMSGLSACCELSPPAGSIVSAGASDQMRGHYVFGKGALNQKSLGAIWFKGHKVARLSREIADSQNPSDDDVFTFMRSFQRSLPESATALITSGHEQLENGDDYVVTLHFSGGRSLIITVTTLDPGASGKRDFVSFEEVLEPVDN
jgi:hypothetical protein